MEKESLDHKMERFRDKVRDARMENVAHTRTHAQQVFLLAGGIAAFLMPLYASTDLTPIQFAFVSTSLACFLLCILLGVANLSYVLHKERLDLKKLHDGLHDPAAFSKYEAQRKPTDDSKLDVLGTFIDILFAFGVLALLCMIGLRVA